MIIFRKENALKKFNNKQRGITLIALIITVILLLILAGIVLNLTLGNNGIFNIAKNASKNYIDAQNKELSDLDKFYSELKIATNDGSTVTVSIEDLKNIIQAEVAKQTQVAPTGINENSLLLESYNDNLGIEHINLTSFTNQFSDNFSQYFNYSEDTGLITCKESGWFLIDMHLSVWNSNTANSVSHGVCYINNIPTVALKLIANSEKNDDTANISIYFKKNDTISFEKYGENASFNTTNNFHIRILKM